jgi:pheromone shutdown-related protein TraB
MVNLLLASYQKKLGSKLGVLPGTELLEATKAAKEIGVPVELADRDVRVTMRRAWASTSLFKKTYLLATLMASMFDNTEVTEKDLQNLKKKDVLSELMDELGKTLPEIKKVVIDERDTFLAEKIKKAKGQKIVAVVGAGHLPGIIKALEEDRSEMMEEINTIPPVSGIWKVIGWAIPILILSSIAMIGFQKGGTAAGENALFWILANGIPSAVGATLALAHPLTIIGAFIAAPVTSLTPVIGAGYVTAFIQVMLCPPIVKEFESAMDDLSTFSGWWSNKLLRVFLAFFLPGFGSMIGTYVGGYELISNLLN